MDADVQAWLLLKAWQLWYAQMNSSERDDLPILAGQKLYEQTTELLGDGWDDIRERKDP